MEKNDDIFSVSSLKICQVDEKSNVSENVFINNEKYVIEMYLIKNNGPASLYNISF